VRGSLFHWSATKEQHQLPEPCGPIVTLTEKLFVPLHEHPDVSIVQLQMNCYWNVMYDATIAWVLIHRVPILAHLLLS